MSSAELGAEAGKLPTDHASSVEVIPFRPGRWKLTGRAVEAYSASGQLADSQTSPRVLALASLAPHGNLREQQGKATYLEELSLLFTGFQVETSERLLAEGDWGTVSIWSTSGDPGD